MPEHDEASQVRARYAKRNTSEVLNRYLPTLPEVVLTIQERQRRLAALFREHGMADLSGHSLIEVGAGTGGNLLELLRMGFSPEHLTAIELLEDRAATARQRLPAALQVIQGNALAVPIEAGSADFVFQSVVFSSLLNDQFQMDLARRMWSWIRPGGALIWYDFTFNNPANKDVRAVPLARVQELFPEALVDAHRVTLAPPISRRVCRIHPSLYGVFNALPFLRTHLLCWLQKPHPGH